MGQGVWVRGARVSLCPFDGAFWIQGLGWYNDPEIIALTSDDPNPLSAAQFRETLQADLDNSQSVVFGVVNETEAPIGIGMLRHVDPLHRGCELHLTIGEKDHWNRGYGTETIGLMRDYAFETLRMHKVLSTPFEGNPRMVRCLEKCGFLQEGVLRDALWIGGRFIDVVIMGAINPADRRD